MAVHVRAPVGPGDGQATGRRPVGRRAEVGRLVGGLSGGGPRIGVSLTGPGRVGKASLLLEAKRRLEGGGVVAAYASAWRTPIGRLDEFAEYLLRQTLESFKGGMGPRAKASSMLAMRGGALADFL